MKTIAIKEFENITELERLCKKEDGPILITKDGQGCFVIMSIEYYNEIMESYEEAVLIEEGLEDVAQGKTIDGPTAIAKIKEKYGL